MGVKVGGIDIANSALNSELRIGVLERVVERLLNVAPPGTVTQEDFEKIRKEVVETLKEKYPNAGITYSNT